jgi:hypothetical protein
MTVGGVAFSLFVTGVVLVVTGKQQAQAKVGFVLLLCCLLVVFLSLAFFRSLVRLF